MRLIGDGVVDREASRAWRPGSATRRATSPGSSPPSSAPGRSRSPGRSAHRRRGRWWRPPTCRCPTSRSPRASRASGSSTRPCARSMRCRRASCAAGVAAGPSPPSGSSSCAWPCARRSPATRCWPSSPTTWCRVSRPPDRAGTPAPSTCRTGPAPCGSRCRQVDHVGETAFVAATFTLTDVRDTAAAVERARRLLDADCDPRRGRRPLRGRPRDRAARRGVRPACGCPVRSTATRSPCAPSSASRSASSAPRP